ncbi:MAG: hypothetical protein QM742_12925 [Aquabacterium sp.]
MFRSAATTLPQTLRQTLRQMGGLALACSLVMLGGCGGGDRAEEYRPNSLVAFGDENSAMESFSGVMDPVANQARTITGLTYTVNPQSSIFWYCPGPFSATAEPCDAGTIYSLESAYTAATGEDTYPYTYPWYHFAGYNTNVLANTVTWTQKGTASYTLTADTTQPRVVVANGEVRKVEHRTYLCSAPSIWIQHIASNFGLAFGDQCALASNTKAYSAAAYGAKVADVATQIQTHQARLGEGVLVTMLVGQHDVLEAFNALLLTADHDAAMTTAQALLDSRAATLAGLVRNIIQTKAKVVLALVPDFSESPYPASVSLSEADRLRLKTLIKRFNDKVYITGLSDVSGRSLVSVNFDLYTNPSLRNNNYNYTDTACVFTATADLKNEVRMPNHDAPATADELKQRVKFCTSYNLRSSGVTYVWADETHLALWGHLQLGAIGASRAGDQF